MSHEAIIGLVTDEHGSRAVVTYADETIWISDDLLAHARDTHRKRIPGDIEADGDQVVFGTPGEGLGRLHYRLVGHNQVGGWHVARRQEA